MPRFFAQFPESLAEGVDALAQPDWGRLRCTGCRQFHRGCALAFPPRALPLAFVAKAHADGLRGEERLRPSLQGPGDDGVLRQLAEALPSFESQRVGSKRPWNLGPEAAGRWHKRVCLYRFAWLTRSDSLTTLACVASPPLHRFALLHSLRSPHPTHGVGRFASPRSPHSLASLRSAVLAPLAPPNTWGWSLRFATLATLARIASLAPPDPWGGSLCSPRSLALLRFARHARSFRLAPRQPLRSLHPPHGGRDGGFRGRPLGLRWDGEGLVGTDPAPAGPLAPAVTCAGAAVTVAMINMTKVGLGAERLGGGKRRIY